MKRLDVLREFGEKKNKVGEIILPGKTSYRANSNQDWYWWNDRQIDQWDKI